MSEERKSEISKDDAGDPKKTFREALEKKRRAQVTRNNNSEVNFKIRGNQEGSGSRKIFRRKSGTA